MTASYGPSSSSIGVSTTSSVELVARVRECALAELGAETRPAAVVCQAQEEPDRRADVEHRPLASVGLELVEDLGELLAVELELTGRGQHVDPEVVRAALAVLVEHERLVDLRIREDERARRRSGRSGSRA